MHTQLAFLSLSLSITLSASLFSEFHLNTNIIVIVDSLQHVCVLLAKWWPVLLVDVNVDDQRCVATDLFKQRPKHLRKWRPKWPADVQLFKD